jgi:hypothetical protein
VGEEEDPKYRMTWHVRYYNAGNDQAPEAVANYSSPGLLDFNKIFKLSRNSGLWFLCVNVFEIEHYIILYAN